MNASSSHRRATLSEQHFPESDNGSFLIGVWLPSDFLRAVRKSPRHSPQLTTPYEELFSSNTMEEKSYTVVPDRHSLPRASCADKNVSDEDLLHLKQNLIAARCSAARNCDNVKNSPIVKRELCRSYRAKHSYKIPAKCQDITLSVPVGAISKARLVFRIKNLLRFESPQNWGSLGRGNTQEVWEADCGQIHKSRLKSERR